MKHYIEHRNTEIVTTKGGEKYGVLAKQQYAFCGKKITITNRSEIATQLVDSNCTDCIERYKIRSQKPFDCTRCKFLLKQDDINHLTPQDEQVLCLSCKKQLNKNL